MRPTRPLLLAALLACPVLVQAPARAQDAPLPKALFDTMSGALPKPFPHYRVNHAKGALYEGSFTPAPGAAALTTAPHLQSTPSTVLVRYSNSGGVPDVADNAPSSAVRGMAFTFHLPDGTETDLMMINVPVFVTRTPEDFLALLKAAGATKPDSPQPSPIAQLLAAHPETKAFFGIPKPMPESFATERFFALHAYKLTNAKGETHFVRFRLVPAGGTAYRAAGTTAALPPNVLFEEMPARVAAGPVAYTLQAQVAAAGDPTNDPTIAWPEDRPIVTLGTLTVTTAVADSVVAERKVGYLPNRELPGLAVSDDPFLKTRAEVYGIAFPARQ